MDRETEKGVQRVKRKVYQKASINNIRLRQKKMRIEVDILDYMMGGVLFIESEDERWRPVAYLSKSLNKTKRNYKIHNKEMLVII